MTAKEELWTNSNCLTCSVLHDAATGQESGVSRCSHSHAGSLCALRLQNSVLEWNCSPQNSGLKRLISPALPEILQALSGLRLSLAV